MVFKHVLPSNNGDVDFKNAFICVNIIVCFLVLRVLPESPRWLLARGRFEEAEKILKKMARVNGKSLPANYMVQLKVRE
jgi:hypothetical protein